MDDNQFKFTHKVDKNKIPTCSILNVKIAAINMEWLLEFTKKNIRKLSGDYMCVSNVHTTVTAYENPQYMDVQNSGVMAIPDGGPLSSLGRKRGFDQMERVTGPGYMEEILNISEKFGYSHYFYGSTEDTLKKMQNKLREKHPNLKIAGAYSPPFRTLTEKEDREIIRKINEASADFLWIGLGAPKQEYWMAAHQGEVDGFMVGVGAAFDYFAGNIERAPMWMQRCNLEWLYRLIQEPKRLFKRYVETNTKFIWYAVIRGK